MRVRVNNFVLLTVRTWIGARPKAFSKWWPQSSPVSPYSILSQLNWSQIEGAGSRMVQELSGGPQRLFARNGRGIF